MKKNPNQTIRINAWELLALRVICKYREMMRPLENALSRKVWFQVKDVN